ncbi:MAG: hypothetical protein GQ525_08690 [Draconibacterium sp.]|nr:hypothetical protein [Draconibacterium sp.]
MNKTLIIAKINSFLQSTEMFARPSKQLPGKWQLFEYYIDEVKELKHVNSEMLTSGKQNWDIEFTENGKYTHSCNLPISLILEIENGSWSTSKNFITLNHPSNFRKNVEFQFAFEKDNLKLLKKDTFGKIEFFGFFRKLN